MNHHSSFALLPLDPQGQTENFINEFDSVIKHREEVKHDFFFNYEELWEIIFDKKKQLEEAQMRRNEIRRDTFKNMLSHRLWVIKGIKTKVLKYIKTTTNGGRDKLRRHCRMWSSMNKNQLCDTMANAIWIRMEVVENIITTKRMKSEDIDYMEEFNNILETHTGFRDIHHPRQFEIFALLWGAGCI